MILHGLHAARPVSFLMKTNKAGKLRSEIRRLADEGDVFVARLKTEWRLPTAPEAARMAEIQNEIAKKLVKLSYLEGK